jgi:hypothetical protein
VDYGIMAKRLKAAAAKRRKLPYAEGTWFAVPLKKKSGYVVGIIARHGHLDRLFGYFFGPRRRAIPTLKAVQKLRPEDSFRRCRFSDVGLLSRRWPIIGAVESWDRADWPLPPFIILDDFEHTAMEVMNRPDAQPPVAVHLSTHCSHAPPLCVLSASREIILNGEQLMHFTFLMLP